MPPACRNCSTGKSHQVHADGEHPLGVEGLARRPRLAEGAHRKASPRGSAAQINTASPRPVAGAQQEQVAPSSASSTSGDHHARRHESAPQPGEGRVAGCRLPQTEPGGQRVGIAMTQPQARTKRGAPSLQ
jgi:hypothetical protein